MVADLGGGREGDGRAMRSAAGDGSGEVGGSSEGASGGVDGAVLWWWRGA